MHSGNTDAKNTYHHNAMANLARGSSSCLQFVVLHLRCGSTSPSTKSNVCRDIQKCFFFHSTSSKWLRSFDQNTGPCGLSSFHTVLADINDIWLKITEHPCLRHWSSNRHSASICPLILRLLGLVVCSCLHLEALLFGNLRTIAAAFAMEEIKKCAAQTTVVLLVLTLLLFWNRHWYHGVKYSSSAYATCHCPTSCFMSRHMFAPIPEAAKWWLLEKEECYASLLERQHCCPYVGANVPPFISKKG